MFIKKGDRNKISKEVVRHETIHTKQMQEMLYVFFYVWYGIEWLIKYFRYKNFQLAYYKISFEREAYKNDYDSDYLEKRKKYNWIKLVIL
jgi:hypothetical protein